MNSKRQETSQEASKVNKTGIRDTRAHHFAETRVEGDAEPPEPVSEKIGKFELRRELGRGGMGAVYLAHDPLIDRDVAIKVLNRSLSENEVSLQRFLGEARSVGKLSHPNVIRVYDVSEQRGDYFIVMEYASGGSVGERLRQQPRLPIREACRLALEAAQGLQAAHQLGMVHRDIKPENLMLAEDGTVKLVDFGLSKFVDQSDELALTRTGQVLGTPIYMSPEQIKSEPLDLRTDIYSLGGTLFHLLTGEPPFAANSYANLIFQHVESPRPDPLKFRPDAPAICTQIVAKSMAVALNDRYSTVEEMIDDLRVAIEQSPDEDDESPVAAAPRVLIAEPSKLGAKVLEDTFLKAEFDVRCVQTKDAAGEQLDAAPDIVVAARSLELPASDATSLILTSDPPAELLEQTTNESAAFVSRKAKPVEFLRAIHAVSDQTIPRGDFRTPPQEASVILVGDDAMIEFCCRELTALGVDNIATRANRQAGLTAAESHRLTLWCEPDESALQQARRLAATLPIGQRTTLAILCGSDPIRVRSVFRTHFAANCDQPLDRSRLLRLVEAC